MVVVGTVLFGVGGALGERMGKSMRRRIIGSVAGHAQVYQASSKDTPSLFEQWQIPDLDPIPDFSEIKGPLLSHPNLAGVSPEGINTAIVLYGNTLHQILDKPPQPDTPRP